MYASLHNVKKKIVVDATPRKSQHGYDRQLKVYTTNGVFNLTLFSNDADALDVEAVDCVAVHLFKE